jgi:integrase
VRIDNKDHSAGNSLAIAREIDAKIKQDKRLGKIEAYRKKERLTFKQFHDKYYEQHYSTLRSAKTMKYLVDYFVECFKDEYLNQITPASIEKVILDKSAGKAPRTRDHYISIILRMFNYALELEILDRNPVKIKQLKVDNARDRYLTPDEEKRLLEECKQSKNPYLFPVVVFALHTGMRKGEIRNFNPETDIRDGKIYVQGHSTKSKKKKIIPINAALAYILNNYRIDFKQDVKKAFAAARDKAGIKDFRFHDLRHTFASRLAQSRTDLYTVSQLLGHKDMKMTQRYSHLNPDSLINEVEKLSLPFLEGEANGQTAITPRKLDLSPEEEERLLEACRASRSNNLYPSVMLALHTGMKQIQMEKLVPGNFKGDHIELDGTIFPLNSELLKVFQDYHPANIDFAGNMRTAFESALKKAGLPRMTFSELRYTYEARKK